MPTTPYPPVGQPADLFEGNRSYVIAMPDTWIDSLGGHWKFAYWDDDPAPVTPSIPATRTINLTQNTSLLVHYIPLFEISIDAAPIRVNFTITPV